MDPETRSELDALRGRVEQVEAALAEAMSLVVSLTAQERAVVEVANRAVAELIRINQGVPGPSAN
jgi:hypothetical protein